jgi:chitodextrinase
LVPGELALSWDAVAGATEYNIYEADTLIGIVTVTNVDIDGLGSEKEYCFEVTAVNTGGESGRTDKVCETTLKIEEPVVLAAPQNLTAEALIHNEIRLSWDSVAGATGYKVYQFEELLGEVKNTTADIYSLADSTQYCFKVTAINAIGESEKSNEACATTLDPVQPEQPEEPGEGVEENATAFNIYPNPVNDKLYIETQTQTLTVEIYDVYGRQQSMVNGQQSTVIDVTSLNSGVYFVKVVTENGEAVRRFIKK